MRFLLLPLCILLIATLAHCSDSPYELNGRDVLVFLSRKNWFRASELCRSRRMQLLNIKSVKDNVDAIKLAKDNGLHSMWIDATDLADWNRWVWFSTGQEVNITFWDDNEPDNIEENCVEVIVEGLKKNWRTTDCQERRSFICEEVVKRRSKGGLSYWLKLFGIG